MSYHIASSKARSNRITPHTNRLVRYIDTYRDPNAESGGEEEEIGASSRRPWYAFWRRGGDGYAPARLSEFETPSDWLNTDLKQGLSTAEVDGRRKCSVWNGLVTEKENMFLKFVGYFRGPILYGRWRGEFRFALFGFATQ